MAVPVPGEHLMAARSPASWTRISLVLIATTMAYNTIEAVVAISSGMAADSIALVGFGLDSLIELSAGAVVLRRLAAEHGGAHPERVARMEHHAHRFVGITFILLGAYVALQAGWTLWHADAPQESLIGIALAIASLTIMPAIAWGKLKAAEALDSASLRAEARETLACSILSLALLLGLGLNALFGWWWADPVAAGLMVPWLIKEGMENLEGQDCCPP